MSFFDWWFKKKEKQGHMRVPNQPIMDVRQKNEIDDLIGTNSFSHIPPLPTPSFIADEFGPLLNESLNTNQHAANPRRRSLEALRIATMGSEYINEDNRAAAILSLIGEEEAMIALRAFRWRNGLTCPRCYSKNIKITITDQSVYVYRCLDCEKKQGSGSTESIFTDLTNIAFAKDMQSVIRWVLICYLKMFCSIGKIAKILGLSVDATVQLLSIVNQDKSFKPKKEKKY
jgi:transposase-like protein